VEREPLSRDAFDYIVVGRGPAISGSIVLGRGASGLLATFTKRIPPWHRHDVDMSTADTR
jgi:hypothetical protein